MRLNLVHLSLILFSFLSSVIGTTSLDDLNACKRACTELILKLHGFVFDPQRNQASFDAITPLWTTCQYRCYRCHLSVAIQNMSKLKKTYNNYQLTERIRDGRLKNQKSAITYSIQQTCYRNWEIAIENNDETSTF